MTCLCGLGLLSRNGRLLNKFVENPVKYFSYMTGMESDDDHRDRQNLKILNEILTRYYSIGDQRQPHQLNELGDVTKHASFPHLNFTLHNLLRHCFSYSQTTCSIKILTIPLSCSANIANNPFTIISTTTVYIFQ
jgi:hypothetical protein